MDVVPFAFCESVYNLFTEHFLKNVQISSKTWKAAARETYEKRMNLWVDFRCVSGVWKYVLHVQTYHDSPTNITFDDLKQLNRKYLHVGGVYLGERRFGDSSYPHLSSLEEIYEISNFILPFLFQPYMEIKSTGNFPEETLSAILLRYQNVSFPDISITDQQKLTENFLTTQLQRGKVVVVSCKLYLEVVDRAENFSDNLRAVLEEFAISRPFRHLNSTMVFRKPFFEIFFKKTTFHGTCKIMGKFSFDLAEFEPELQDSSLSVGDKKVAWRREDGVLVNANWLCGQNWIVSLNSN